MIDASWTKDRTCRTKQIVAYAPSGPYSGQPSSCYESFRIEPGDSFGKHSQEPSIPLSHQAERSEAPSSFSVVQSCETAEAGGNLLPDYPQPETPLVRHGDRWPGAPGRSGLRIRLRNGR